VSIVTLLLRDPGAPAKDAPAAPPDEAAPGVRACATCGDELEPGQDWCLRCGEAQPGRLGGRPGARAVATVVALTLLLCSGAVAAAYAALQDEPAGPAAPAPLAQAPAPAPAPVPVPAPAPAPAPTDEQPPAPADDGADVPAPAATPPAADRTPDVPAPAAKDDTGSTSGGAKDDTAGQGDGGDTPAKDDKPAEPVAIDLGADAVEGYDPYSRAVAKGDPVDAYDGDPSTSWYVDAPEGAQQIGAGLLVDLGAKRGVKALELVTRTPGFRTEIYATDSTEVPPDVLDTRWAHVKDASDVGAEDSGKERIVLGGGTTKYRYVLLWFTTPPKEGVRVRINELSLFR
jgi:hypothetical protein